MRSHTYRVLYCEPLEIDGWETDASVVCLLDFLTGKKIYSGIVLEKETAQLGEKEIWLSWVKTLPSWEAARNALWEYINSDTIIVGHGLYHDFDTLKMVPPRIVDSDVLAQHAIGYGRRV